MTGCKAPARASLTPVVISWGLFTGLFWIAAYSKPFHVDEFYSWVYAMRNSWRDIVLLNDGGIGHPPLYHLVQKLVQSILPDYHPLNVRIANYAIGSAFVFLMTGILTRDGKGNAFSYGFSCSAGLLDAFVFSRMWGAVCLVSLLVFRSGEAIVSSRSDRKAGFLALFALGVATDYNFFVLAPYAAIVLASNTRFGMRALHGLLPVLLLLWILGEWYKAPDATAFTHNAASNMTTMGLETGFLLLGLRFQEPFLIALLCMVLSCAFGYPGREGRETDRVDTATRLFLMSGIILAVLDVLRRASVLRGRHVAAVLVLLLAVAIRGMAGKRNDVAMTEEGRMMIAVAGGILVVLVASLFFWRTLLEKRFVIALVPFLVIMVHRSLDRTALLTMSVVLVASGLLYVSSSVVDDHYPASPPDVAGPVVFQNEFAYATRYLKDRDGTGSQAYFLAPLFQRNCRTCAMGSTDVPFQSWDNMVVVGFKDPQPYIPGNFKPVDRKDIGLTLSDRLQFRFLTTLPRSETRFTAWEYRKVGSPEKASLR